MKKTSKSIIISIFAILSLAMCMVVASCDKDDDGSSSGGGGSVTPGIVGTWSCTQNTEIYSYYPAVLTITARMKNDNEVSVTMKYVWDEDVTILRYSGTYTMTDANHGSVRILVASNYGGYDVEISYFEMEDNSLYVYEEQGGGHVDFVMNKTGGIGNDSSVTGTWKSNYYEEEITYVFNNDGTGRLTYIDEYYDTPDVYRYDFTYEMTNSTHGSLVYDGYYGMESHLFEIEEDRMYVFQEADNQVVDMVYKQ